MIPKELLLKPESRQPLVLPKATVDTILARPIPQLDKRHAQKVQQSAAVRISIIVVSFNNLVFTRLCLESVLDNTAAEDFELIVVDNESTDGSVEYLKKLSGLNEPVTIQFNDHNLGFARACNQGLELASGDVLVLLNNDTVVPPGWLRELVRRLEEPTVGMAGPVTNRCGNEAEIEVPYRSYGGMLEFARQRARQHAGEGLNLRMLTMFCVAFRSEVYQQIGPLDERFETGLFEDEDYSMRLAEAGYTLVCAEDVFVHHFGQASIGKLASSGDYGELFHANRRRFEEKWAMRWQPHAHRPNASYHELVENIRQIIDSRLPPGATVIVASKGDEDLVTLAARRGWHFPQEHDGTYSGHHPANSAAAIQQLEKLRDEGGEFLVLPAPMFWWLQFYPEFAVHLAHHYSMVEEGRECLIYLLGESAERVDHPPAMEYLDARGIDCLNRKLVTVVVAVLESDSGFGDFLVQFARRVRHSCRLLIIDNPENNRETLAKLDELGNIHNKAALVTMERTCGYVAAVNLGCSLAPGDVIVMNTSLDLYDGWLDEMSAFASSQERLATAGNEQALFITRKALRKVGPLDGDRFPDWSDAVADFRTRTAANGFVHGSPGLAPGQNLTAKPRNRPCLLAIVHAGSGGSRFSLEDLLPEFSAAYQCLMLETGPDAWGLFEARDGHLSLIRQYRFSDSWCLDKALGEERCLVLADICEAFNVRLVNVHHLLGNGPEVLDYLAQEGLPVVFSFHDYYAVCPTAHLIDNTGNYCGGTCSDGTGLCPLNRQFFQAPIPALKHEYVHVHRNRMALALSRCQAYTAPSNCTKQGLLNAFSSLRNREFQVIEHGRDMKRIQAGSEPGSDMPAKVICIGTLSEPKGSGLIRELMALNQLHGRRFEFHFLGGRSRELRPEQNGGIYYGAYHRDELPGLLMEISPSFSLLASICEETFSCTLSESWAAGIPVIASNRGALRERIEKHAGGWLFDPDDPDAFFTGMLRILDSPGAWRQQTDMIRHIPLPSTATEASQMLQLFGQVLSLGQVQ
jgi:GT2 family glycosyltransferase/glycosyltransferase involved in cell wall biosynthesis